MEGFVTGFQVLLGSAEAATDRMRELSKFAADTPFELPEVAQASRTLETLTKGALATGKGLTLVGDVAAGTQQPFAEIATWVGRLYDGLQSGRPVGEAMARMQELGVISGETRARIEQLQTAGKKGDDVWNVMSAALGRFSGMMKQQSGTWNGLMSTLQDGIAGVFREFGTPILPQLKPILSEGIGLTEQIAAKAREWGAAVADGIALLRGANDVGRLGELVGLSLKVGFGEAISFLVDKLADGIVALKPVSASALEGLELGFASIGFKLGAQIKRSIAESLPDNLAFAGTRQRLEAGAAKDDVGARATGILARAKLNDVAGPTIAEMIVGDMDEAKGKLAALVADLRTATPGELLGPTIEQLRGLQTNVGSPASPVAAAAPPQIKPMSDQLARIGGFIGGNGGRIGERAQQETARNTGRLVDLQNRMLDVLGKPATGGATF